MRGQVTSRLPILLGFLIAVGPISTDMYLPAFPALAADLHNPAVPQYSLASYFLGLACGQMTWGALSDRIGRRIPLLVGMALYIVATLGCTASWNTESLVVFRFLTAVGASAGLVIPRAIVRDLADGPAAAKLMSKLMLVMGVAPICAPMLGALCIMFVGWRFIFGLCALYGVIACICAWFYLPDTLPPERRTMLGLGSVLIKYVDILFERGFCSHAIVNACVCACLFAYLSGSPQIFEDGFGWSSTGYAVLFGVNSIAYIGYSQINPSLVNRFGVAPVITVMCIWQVICALLVVFLALFPHGGLALAGSLTLCEAAFGLLLPCCMVGALSRHQAHAGSASALLGTLAYCGGAVAGMGVGVLADGTARPMALVMLGSAAIAALAAYYRPRLEFSKER